MAQDVSRSRQGLISRKHLYDKARLWRRWHRRSGNEVIRTFDIRALLETFQPLSQELYSVLGRTAADELLVQMMAIDRSAVVSMEQIERDVWLDLFSGPPAETATAWGIQSARLPPATVFAMREAPLVEFNRAIGIGVVQPATEEELDRVVAWLKTHANATWALQIASMACTEPLLSWMRHNDLIAWHRAGKVSARAVTSR